MFVAAEPPEAKPADPCVPSPCGPNAACQDANGNPDCRCLEGYFGSPPDCRPECRANSDCPLVTACVNQRCEDPCKQDPCGTNALCEVVNHNPICYCPEHLTGDPFIRCFPHPVPHEPAGKEDGGSKNDQH